jgi:hypothetical protein
MLVSLGVPSASGAGLLISIGELEQSGGSGSFEVLLTNTEPVVGTTFNIAGFSFELLAAPGSGITFTAADYPTSGPAPYIFDGTGQTTLDPTIPLSEDAFPNTNFSGADTEFTYASIPVAPGDMFSLGLISFTATSTVSLGELQGLVVRAGTTLSDENFQPIAYSLAAASVPEPSSLVMAAVGGALVLVVAVARRTGR